MTLDGLRQLWHDNVQVADDAQVTELEDGRVLVLVDGDNQPSGAHTRLVLDGAGDAAGNVDGGLDGLASLPHLMGIGNPAGVYRRAGGANAGAQRCGELLNLREALRATQPPPARDDDLRLLELGSARRWQPDVMAIRCLAQMSRLLRTLPAQGAV